MVPDRRRTVLVRVLEDGGAGLRANAIGPSRLGREEAEPGAVPGVAGDVLGRRSSRLRVAVAVVGHAHRAVDGRTIGTGPVYGPGVSVKVGRVSRPVTPPGALAQCSVGSTGSRCGR